jgi:hypothetical protein
VGTRARVPAKKLEQAREASNDARIASVLDSRKIGSGEKRAGEIPPYFRGEFAGAAGER